MSTSPDASSKSTHTDHQGKIEIYLEEHWKLNINVVVKYSFECKVYILFNWMFVKGCTFLYSMAVTDNKIAFCLYLIYNTTCKQSLLWYTCIGITLAQTRVSIQCELTNSSSYHWCTRGLCCALEDWVLQCFILIALY